MDYLLRTYAHVRNLLRDNNKGSGTFRETKEDRSQPPADTSPLLREPEKTDDTGPAELLIKNAAVFPPLDGGKSNTHIAVKNGRILSLGPRAAETAGPDTKTLDVRGRGVIPGFCDCHLHLTAGAEQAGGLNLEDVRDHGTFKARLKKFIADNPEEPVYYAYGLHYMDDPLIPSLDARETLDAIEPDKPLFIYAHDLHTGWANSRALKTAGLSNRVPPYPELLCELGLEENLVLDKIGRPSGEMREPPVYFLVQEALRRAFPLTVEQKKSRLEETCRHLASRGLTSVHNMGLDLPEEDIEYLILLLELEEEGRLPIRVYSSCSVVPDEYMLDDIRRAAEVRDNLKLARNGDITAQELRSRLFTAMKMALASRGKEKAASGSKSVHDRFSSLFSHLITPEHVREHESRSQKATSGKPGYLSPEGKVQCKAVKLFMDGVVEKDTAFRLDRHPVPGIPAFNNKDLDRAVCLADHLGLQVAAHCIGNGSVNAMLNSVEEARTENAQTDRKRGDKVRHRIEHIELCNSFDIPRFSRLEVIASMQALHEREPVTLWHEKIPEIEWSTAFPWKSLINSGATLVFGSDWPIVSCNCLKGIERATARRPWKTGMPEQHLQPVQALAAFTSSAARAEYAENVKGEILPGMLADIAVLSRDLRGVEAGFEDIRVLHTINGGEVVYSNGEE